MTDPQGNYKILILISESPPRVAEHVIYLGNPGSEAALVAESIVSVIFRVSVLGTRSGEALHSIHF